MPTHSSYRLATFKDGIKSTSCPFITPGPGIYQIITNLGFSISIDLDNNPYSCLDNDTINLMGGNILVDKYIVSQGIRTDENRFDINGDMGATKISFSLIDREGKTYIYGPILKLKTTILITENQGPQ